MAYKCELCGKGVQYGHNVSHSKRRTRKIFKPNLHWARVLVGGSASSVGKQRKRMRLCTKCLRSVKKTKIVEKEKTTLAKSTLPQTPAPSA